MTDIVVTLREYADFQPHEEWHFTRPRLLEAADEIERLRALSVWIGVKLEELNSVLDRGKGAHGQDGYVRDDTWNYWLGQRSILEQASRVCQQERQAE